MSGVHTHEYTVSSGHPIHTCTGGVVKIRMLPLAYSAMVPLMSMARATTVVFIMPRV